METSTVSMGGFPEWQRLICVTSFFLYRKNIFDQTFALNLPACGAQESGRNFGTGVFKENEVAQPKVFPSLISYSFCTVITVPLFLSSISMPKILVHFSGWREEA
jgi:hypothetical protein